MATLQTWRKAYGALKDSTKVGLAHVNSDYADLDVAIVKATNHVECPPKERHLRKILVATSAIRPRADVAYCIHALARRLSKTRNWTVALKTLIVIHRTLREGDPTFREELLNFTQRARILQLSNFKDDSSPIAWDCSAWVRTYALFLEERLECFRILKYDIESERLPRPAQGQEKGYSRTRELDSEELLEHLPALQQLLYRLIGCRPEGAAIGNYVIQYALALVLKESFKIYCAINDGIINLVDKFFEMPRHEAIKALDIYKRAGQQLQLTYKQEDSPEDPNLPTEEPEASPSDNLSITPVETAPPPPPAPAPAPEIHLDTGDLLGLSLATTEVSAIEDRNAMALAIVPSGDAAAAPTFDSNAVQAKDFDPTGWELALVTTPSTNISSANERQLAGGLDTLTLDSLYDEGAYRASLQPVYGKPAPNPFEVQDPFALSSAIAPPPSVQMAPLAQQQANPFGPYQPTFPQQQQPFTMDPTNPFGDAGFGAFPAPNHHPVHPPASNPFGSTGIL